MYEYQGAYTTDHRAVYDRYITNAYTVYITGRYYIYQAVSTYDQ